MTPLLFILLGPPEARPWAVAWPILPAARNVDLTVDSERPSRAMSS
jgi:hypothetical protein